MCGRYATTLDPETLYGIFNATPAKPDPEVPLGSAGPGTAEYGGDPKRPRYNIGPATDNPVVRIRQTDDGDVRRIDFLHWGLIPSWAKDPKIGNKLINARAESVGDKPAFRRALAKRRCLVPASGFFEWQKLDQQPATGSGRGRAAAKQPFYIRPADGSVMAFAGLWEYWKPAPNEENDDPEPIVSYTILTTDAVGEMNEIHTRMPLILPADRWDEWLDPSRNPEEVAALLAPPSPELVRQLEFRPIGGEVGNVRNDSAEIIKPLVRATSKDKAKELEEQPALPLG